MLPQEADSCIGHSSSALAISGRERSHSAVGPRSGIRGRVPLRRLIEGPARPPANRSLVVQLELERDLVERTTLGKRHIGPGVLLHLRFTEVFC